MGKPFIKIDINLQYKMFLLNIFLTSVLSDPITFTIQNVPIKSEQFM